MEPICSEANVILYIERELEEADMLRMEAHFPHCPQCRQSLAEHRLVRLALNKASRVPVPQDFSDRVIVRLPLPFQNFLHTAREKIMATAMGITLTAAATFSYLVGSQASQIGNLFSLSWWNQVFFQLFSLFTDSFRLLLHLTRMLVSVGGFLFESVAFILVSIGRLLVVSPQGHTLVLLILIFFMAASALFSRKSPLAVYGHRSNPRSPSR